MSNPFEIWSVFISIIIMVCEWFQNKKKSICWDFGFFVQFELSVRIVACINRLVFVHIVLIVLRSFEL